jgi:hypothetical protein
MSAASGLRHSRTPNSIAFATTTIALVLAIGTGFARAQVQTPQAKPDAPAAATVPAPVAVPGTTAATDAAQPANDTIPAGTTINAQNWQQYQQFMPDGMVALFQGKYFWKMPPDVQMELGPTIIHPLPKTYLDATEKFASQVKLVDLPGGGMTLSGYQGGIPFPNPAEPHQGWKILANLWYRYLPHLIVDTHGSGCLVDSSGSVNCQAAQIVSRQLDYNTDPNTPVTYPGAEGKFSTEFLMVLEPEQQRYTAFLTISYADPAKPEDTYLFLPQLRRYQAVSSAARCSPNQGTDSTQEDYRFGFNSNITELQVEVLGEKKILAMLNANLPSGEFPANFDMPLGWPMPSWGKWQLRDVYEIGVSKIPSKGSGYCYGKRVMYVDKTTFAPLWEDLYDRDLKLWRIFGLFHRAAEIQGIGPVDTSGSMVWAFWDVENSHATFFIDPGAGHTLYLNDQAPKEYLDLTRFSSAPGLNQIMR